MTINKEKVVWVYRNLSRGRKSKPLYSVVWRGKVITRRHQVLLKDARFVVREAGRQRVLKEHRKNVHAFVVGTLVSSAMGITAKGKDLPTRIRYNPYEAGYFQPLGIYPDGARAIQARVVLLNKNGISAALISYGWSSEGLKAGWDRLNTEGEKLK